MITILMAYIFVLSIIAVIKLGLELHKTNIDIKKIIEIEKKNQTLFGFHREMAVMLNEKNKSINQKGYDRKNPYKKKVKREKGIILHNDISF